MEVLCRAYLADVGNDVLCIDSDEKENRWVSGTEIPF